MFHIVVGMLPVAFAKADVWIEALELGECETKLCPVSCPGSARDDFYTFLPYRINYLFWASNLFKK